MLPTFADVISPSLASLYNLSIYTGQILADWKLCNVVPIPKEPSKNEISLLPIVIKVLERYALASVDNGSMFIQKCALRHAIWVSY